jgi:cytochrome c oxidase assembly protein subunit 17
MPEEQKENGSVKPCCACPETRKARDECVFLYGEEDCYAFIEAHWECLRSRGIAIERPK